MSANNAHPLPSSVYKPFQPGEDIRLVEIHPGNAPADVRCSILHTNLNQAPQYEALSYTWGSNEDRQTISCGPDGATIDVTSNCKSSLRRLRRSTESRLVWIDAICINQSDIPERNAQVAIMGQIYQKASLVIVDIGETSKDSEAALFAIQNVSLTRLYDTMMGLDIQDCVDNLYGRPWFERIWILQEVFMAREATVLCGTTLVPWMAFKPLEIWVWNNGAAGENWHMALPSHNPVPLTIGSRSNKTYTARQDFLDLLCKGRTCKATEPRDKVFALLPLLEDAKDILFQADYSKSAETVFIETATWLASNSGISFLSCVQGDSSLSLPSWVPDWSTHFRTPWVLGLSGLFYPLRANLGTKAVAEVLNFPNQLPELKVRGTVVDTIRTLTNDLNIRSAASPFGPSASYLATEAFISDFQSYRAALGSNAVKLRKYGYWNQTTNDPQVRPPDWMIRYGLPFERAHEMTDNEHAGEVTYFCYDRQLFTTTKGYLGVVTGKARVGDLVCLLLGAAVPFILRKVEEGCGKGTNRHFKLVGEAYVYGLMNGEALDGIELEEVGGKVPTGTFQDFHIC
jgi:hypothetical protein